MTVNDKTRITVQQFERILEQPANQDRLLELIDGEIVEKMPTQEHGAIVANLIIEIGIYLRQHKIGFVATEARHGVADDDENDLLPDISFSAGESAPLKKGSVPRMPDLAVEVKSPSDKPHKIEKKASYYLQNGSQMVWLVYPDTQEVVHLSKDDQGNVQRQTFTAADTLTGGNVLPGFTLPVITIFSF